MPTVSALSTSSVPATFVSSLLPPIQPMLPLITGLLSADSRIMVINNHSWLRSAFPGTAPTASSAYTLF